MNRVVLFFALTLVSLSANAFDYGRWLCDCTLERILASSTSKIPSPTEVLIFIRYNNPAIMKSGPNGRWVPNDRITVCDGQICLESVYQAAGVWLPVPPGTRPDNGKGYKNASLTIIHGTVGGSTSQYSAIFNSVNYSGTTPYERTRTVTVGPITVVPTPDGGYIGGGTFNFGFSWGSARNSSDAGFTGQGGTIICGRGGACQSINIY